MDTRSRSCTRRRKATRRHDGSDRSQMTRRSWKGALARAVLSLIALLGAPSLAEALGAALHPHRARRQGAVPGRGHPARLLRTGPAIERLAMAMVEPSRQLGLRHDLARQLQDARTPRRGLHRRLAAADHIPAARRRRLRSVGTSADASQCRSTADRRHGRLPWRFVDACRHRRCSRQFKAQRASLRRGDRALSRLRPDHRRLVGGTRQGCPAQDRRLFRRVQAACAAA